MRQAIQNILENKGKLEDVLNAFGSYHIRNIFPFIQYGCHIGYYLDIDFDDGLTITIDIDKQGFLLDYH